MSFRNIFRLGGIGLLFAIPLLFLMQEFLFSDVRVGRFLHFRDPFGAENVKGIGWQLANSYIALGSGGLKGLRPRTRCTEVGLFTRITHRFYYGSYC